MIGKFLKYLITFLIIGVLLVVIYCGIDAAFNSMLPHVSRAVLSNFIVFALVIAVVMEKNVKPTEAIKKAQEDVFETINVSEAVKVEAQERLNTIEDSVANIETEIESILSKAEDNARLVGEKVVQDGQKTAITVRENAVKSIENDRHILRNELLRRASLASVEVARQHIIKELEANSGLHDKLIDESIEAIEGAKE